MNNQVERPQITKDDFVAWRDSPVTRNFLQAIVDRIDEKSEVLANGGVLGEYCEARYANAVGYIAAMNEVLEFEPADVGVEYGH